MKVHENKLLRGGKLIQLVSDESLRGFNVVTRQIFKEGFAKLNPTPEDLPEPNYEFPTMIGEEKATKKYEEMIKLY